MKVITEEMLIAALKDSSCKTAEVRQVIAVMIKHCKEIDALTVSKLRPMSEAPRNGKFLVVLNSEYDFHECSFLADGRIKIGTVAIRYECCIGWIPKPIYKPEEQTKSGLCEVNSSAMYISSAEL